MFCNKVAEKGQALIELILATALAAIFLAALATGVIAAREGFARSSKSLDATLILQKEIEAIRSIKETGWNSIANPGPYHVEQSGNGWIVVAGSTTDPTNGFTRSFTVENVCRTALTSLPVSCGGSGTIVDPSTKKITATVSWSFFSGQSVSSTFYLTRYFGNKTWVQTTAADFNAGTKTNTVVTNDSGGEVKLNPTSSTANYGNQFLVTATSSIGSMTSQPMKTSLRFTAQSAKTVSALRVYLQTEAGTSPNYRYGIQTDVNGSPSGTYLGSGTLTATTTGWQTITISPAVNLTAGTTYHIVVQWNSGTISTSRYIALRRSSPLNGLYPLSNTLDNSANTIFYNGTNWAVQGYQPIYELDFSDATYEGNPYDSAMTQVAIFGTNFVGEKFKITDSSKTATDISFYVSRVGTPRDNLTVVLWDADTNSLIEQGIIATPTASTNFTYQKYTFATPRTLTLNKNYRIYLTSAGSRNTNNSYRVNSLSPSNTAANFISITYDGANSFYTASTNSGSSWTDTNYSDIGGFVFTTQETGYATAGSFDSQTFNGGSIVGFNYVTMTVAEPTGTNIRLQVATNNDQSTWNFAGPDGTSSTYFDNSGAIYLSQISGQYLRFRAFLTSSGTTTPTLYDVTINYSP